MTRVYSSTSKVNSKGKVAACLCLILVLWGSVASGPALGLDAEDRLNHRWVSIINIVGSDILKKGSFLEVQLLDSQEFVEVEVLGIRRIGNDLELELLDSAANNHFFVELAVDGLTELKANATGLQ